MALADDLPTPSSACAVCGAPLTSAEALEAREAGREPLCSVHAAELLPAEELEDAEGAEGAP